MIHYGTTKETVNVVHGLAHSRNVDLSISCALLDKAWAVDELRGAVQASDRRFELICVPSVHDALLAQVRTWARMGYDGVKIQRELDHQFADILNHTAALTYETDPTTTPDVRIVNEGTGGDGEVEAMLVEAEDDSDVSKSPDKSG